MHISTHKIRATYGLKYNPFLSDIPSTSIYLTDDMLRFINRSEQLISEGGFALVCGEPGLGKSAFMRHLRDRLHATPGSLVKVLARPHSRLRDFYYEISEIFGVKIGNRYACFKNLRDTWLAQICSNTSRPVLLIDEAQQVQDEVLSEIRFLGSTELDARCILSVVLAGDSRLLQKLQKPELLPLESRVRYRLQIEKFSVEECIKILTKSMQDAGNSELMSPSVVKAIAEQCFGNLRNMMIMSNELLNQAALTDKDRIDENLFFETFRGNLKKFKK